MQITFAGPHARVAWSAGIAGSPPSHLFLFNGFVRAFLAGVGQQGSDCLLDLPRLEEYVHPKLSLPDTQDVTLCRFQT